MRNKYRAGKQYLTSKTYILISVLTADMFILTALPYYCLTSIVIPGFNIYWSYTKVQKDMSILFPLLSLIGAISTIQKKNTFEDVLINLFVPLDYLLVLKSAQYCCSITYCILVASIVLSLVMLKRHNYYKQSGRGKWQTRRKCYYLVRRTSVCFLLLLLTPTAIWSQYKADNEKQGIYQTLFCVEAEIEADSQSPVFSLLSSEQWDSMDAESRFSYMKEFLDYQTSLLGVGEISLYAKQEEVNDGSLGVYCWSENAIYLNVVYLNTCSLEEALVLVAHESYHKYEYILIECLNQLETLDIDADLSAMNYFNDIVELRSASEDYAIDNMEYESYYANLLEQEARAYAEEEISRIMNDY